MIQNKRKVASVLFVLVSSICLGQTLPPPGPPVIPPGLPIDGYLFAGIFFGIYYGAKKLLKGH